MKKCCLKGRRSHIGEILPGSIFSVGERDRDYFKRKTSGRFRFPANLSRITGQGKTARGRSVAMGKSVFSRIAAELVQRSWDKAWAGKPGRKSGAGTLPRMDR